MRASALQLNRFEFVSFDVLVISSIHRAFEQITAVLYNIYIALEHTSNTYSYILNLYSVWCVLQIHIK